MNEQVNASAKCQYKHQTLYILTSDVKVKHTVQWNTMFEMWIYYSEHQFLTTDLQQKRREIFGSMQYCSNTWKCSKARVYLRLMKRKDKYYMFACIKPSRKTDILINRYWGTSTLFQAPYLDIHSLHLKIFIPIFYPFNLEGQAERVDISAGGLERSCSLRSLRICSRCLPSRLAVDTGRAESFLHQFLT